MPQYEFIETRFYVRATIQKVAKSVKRLFVFSGTDHVWPDQIEYNLVASVTGTRNEEEIIGRGFAPFEKYSFYERYDRPTPNSLSINDLTSGKIGWHEYYPIDLSNVQPYIMQFINKLGQEGWELVSAPPSSGKQSVKLEVDFGGADNPRREFKGGEQRFYIGQDRNNSSGFAYSLKRQK